MKRKRWFYYLLPLVILVGAGLAFLIWHQSTIKPKMPGKTSSKTKQAQATLDPLAIEAIRSRVYTASPIITTQQLDHQNGYTDAIISYKSDGYTVFALQSTPTGTMPAGGWPVIIFDHGYINPAEYTTNDASYRGFIAPLTRAGYMVIKIDYRGHGNSEGSPEGGHFSPAYAYDNLNLIASLKHYDKVNANRIGLIGHSLGGHVALRTIVASKDIKATVLAAGVVGSITDILYNWPHSPMPQDQPAAALNATKQALFDKYGDPHANPEFWNSVSAINFVEYISSKVQIDHSTDDAVVPIQFSQSLVAALQKANKSVEYYYYPGNDHQFSTNRTLLIQRMATFFRANL